MDAERAVAPGHDHRRGARRGWGHLDARGSGGISTTHTHPHTHTHTHTLGWNFGLIRCGFGIVKCGWRCFGVVGGVSVWFDMVRCGFGLVWLKVLWVRLRPGQVRHFEEALGLGKERFGQECCGGRALSQDQCLTGLRNNQYNQQRPASFMGEFAGITVRLGSVKCDRDTFEAISIVTNTATTLQQQQQQLQHHQKQHHQQHQCSSSNISSQIISNNSNVSTHQLGQQQPQ